MKTLILVYALTVGISAAATAQVPAKQDKKSNSKTEAQAKEGVKIVDNKTVLFSNDKSSPLKETYTCTDGCKVSTDGTITKPDGSAMKLMSGYEIGKDGKVSMIPHGEEGHICTSSCPMHGKM
jgi:hypothetical protein